MIPKPIEGLFYMAAPLSPLGNETEAENVLKAEIYLGSLVRAGWKVIAPWISLVRALNDCDPDERKLGIEIDLMALRRCDGVIAVGPRISFGMQQEINLAVELGMPVIRWTTVI